MLRYIKQQNKQQMKMVNCLKVKFRCFTAICDSVNHDFWALKGVNWIIHKEAKLDDLMVSTDFKHYGKGLCDWNEMFSDG